MAKAKDLIFKAKAKAKNSKFVLEDISRPRTKAKDNNTGICAGVLVYGKEQGVEWQDATGSGMWGGSVPSPLR